MDVADEHRRLQLNELEEIKDDAYKSSQAYNDKNKAFRDKMISSNFIVG